MQIFLDPPTIEEHDIQGDVLVGLQKKAEIFLFFAIRDAARFKQDLKAFVPTVTPTDVTRRYEIAATARKAKLTFNPADLARTLKVNIAFSARGLDKLGATYAGADSLFAQGMEAGAVALGDDLSAWKSFYRGRGIDGVLLIAAWNEKIEDAETDALNEASILLSRLGGTAEVGREIGTLFAGNEGHERFGFADGVSQPAVAGLHIPVAADDQSLPGQDIVKLGDFLLGPYDHEKDEKQSLPPQPWMKNGSYLVFRRLRQDVEAFKNFTENHFTGFADSAEQFGARLVGRWKDGSPLARDPVMANDAHGEAAPFENNDFEFGVQKVAQTRCPFNAHIRRVYPRSDIQDGDGNAEARRILRAGIAFDHTNDTGGDEGLLFACYQSSIKDKFFFIQTDWANKDSIPFDPPYVPGLDGTMPDHPGIDLLIGQAPVRGATWDGGKQLSNVPKFVTATGGEYFFSPSIAGLSALAG